MTWRGLGMAERENQKRHAAHQGGRSGKIGKIHGFGGVLRCSRKLREAWQRGPISDS